MRIRCTETLWPKIKQERKGSMAAVGWRIKEVDGGFLATNSALERQNCLVMGEIIYPHNSQEGQCGILHLNTYKRALSSLCKKGICVAQLIPQQVCKPGLLFCSLPAAGVVVAASDVDKFCE